MSAKEALARSIPRHDLARERAVAARRALLACDFCSHHCGVNRLQGPAGLCHAGPRARIFAAQVGLGDELPFLPTFGISLSGCDLRCDFCITGRESWDARAGELLDPEELGKKARASLAAGARSVMVLGGEPTVHLPAACDIVAELPGDCLTVWKTNGHASSTARSLLDGLFDCWLVDFKFGNDRCAQRLAKVPRYLEVIAENMLWAAEHSRLVIRHLLMPGHLDCCWGPIAAWLRDHLPGIPVSLRHGFWPAWHSERHSELARPFSAADQDRAMDLARQHDLSLWT